MNSWLKYASNFIFGDGSGTGSLSGQSYSSGEDLITSEPVSNYGNGINDSGSFQVVRSSRNREGIVTSYSNPMTGVESPDVQTRKGYTVADLKSNAYYDERARQLPSREVISKSDWTNIITKTTNKSPPSSSSQQTIFTMPVVDAFKEIFNDPFKFLFERIFKPLNPYFQARTFPQNNSSSSSSSPAGIGFFGGLRNALGIDNKQEDTISSVSSTALQSLEAVANIKTLQETAVGTSTIAAVASSSALAPVVATGSSAAVFLGTVTVNLDSYDYASQVRNPRSIDGPNYKTAFRNGKIVQL